MASTEGVGLGKQLADSDKKTRDRTVRRVERWLASHAEATELEHMKLWKALFYCMWMSDKVPVQQQLAQQLANMMHAMSPSQALVFFKAFVLTMQREWPGLDKWRLDKFFTLVRRFVAALFTVAKTQAWSQEATAAAAALIASPLLSLPPNGLRYHTTDLFITELRKVDAAVPATAFLTLLRPFLALLHQSDDAPLFKRVVRDVFTPILDAEEARLDTEGDAAATRTAADAAGACFQHAPLRTLLPELQKIAGDQDTRESQRSKVYALLKRVRALVARLPKEEEPTAVATPGKRDRKSKKKTKKPKSAKKAKKTPKKAHKEAASTPATTGRLSGAKRRRSAVEEAVGAGSVAAEDDNDTGAMATHRASKKARAAKDTPSAGQAKKMKKKAKKAKKATKQQASQDQEEAPATPRSPPPTSMASSEETSHTPAPKSVTRPKSVVWSTKKKVRVFRKKAKLRNVPTSAASQPPPKAGVLKDTGYVPPPPVTSSKRKRRRKAKTPQRKVAADYFS